MTASAIAPAQTTTPDFCNGVLHFANLPSDFERLGARSAIPEGAHRIEEIDDAAVYQTRLMADALRYTTLQLCASKESGHPGGFASSADAYAALVMLGHTNILTEVGHHAPGFYSAMFLDGSLEAMGISDMHQLQTRFRERDGLLGHLSGAIPGLLAPAGPLGQGQHFAMAAAYLHRETLFPVTIGDGGLGEPYILSAFKHFHTAYPEVTNFLPVLIWNGFSQEHHSMVSLMDNARMLGYWRAHDFGRVILIDAKDYDDAGQVGDNATKPSIAAALERGALAPEAWALVRTNMQRAGGGPAGETAVTESERVPSDIGTLPTRAFAVGEKAVPASAMAEMVAELGRRDPLFVVTNADGNEASNMKAINEALKIRHPTEDGLYNQSPTGQVYEPLSEDACAGFAAGLALFGGRSLWLSYESFAINGWPIVQTVGQAMAELRRKTPALVSMFTAGALEQGRNGWTHQRPEIENYIGGQMRNGNVYLLYPADANQMQAAYGWATEQFNKCISIIASKSALPVYSTPEQAREAIEQGAVCLADTGQGPAGTVVFAVTGDMVALPVFAAKETLETAYRVRIVAVVNPRRLYRPGDVAWRHSAEPDDRFMSDADFGTLFDGDALIGVSGGGTVALEPVLLRSRAAARDLFGWRRGETTASPAEIMDFNGITAETLDRRARDLITAARPALDSAA